MVDLLLATFVTTQAGGGDDDAPKPKPKPAGGGGGGPGDLFAAIRGGATLKKVCIGGRF